MRLLLNTLFLLVCLLTAFRTCFAQAPEFNRPWKNPNVALAIDPFEGNEIDWEKLATDKRVVAITHRATIGDRVDKKYAERKIEAKKRGYKWGAYHFGKPGDPIKQANFFLKTVKPEAARLRIKREWPFDNPPADLIRVQRQQPLIDLKCFQKCLCAV